MVQPFKEDLGGQYRLSVTGLNLFPGKAAFAKVEQ